jgi:hypothetical protein
LVAAEAAAGSLVKIETAVERRSVVKNCFTWSADNVAAVVVLNVNE